MNVTYQHCEQYSILVCSVHSKSCVMEMYTISYFCRDVTTMLYFSAVLFSGSNSLMDLMVSFSWNTSIEHPISCFSFLATGLLVGRHDIGRLKTLDGRDERHTRRVFRPLTDKKFSWIDLKAISLGQYVYRCLLITFILW